MKRAFQPWRIFSSGFAERFWDKVSREPGQGPDGTCWQWQGAMMGQTGYGQVSIGFLHRGAHRVAWAIENGRWPSADEHVCHKCDNPPCVNPSHLWAGDRTANMRDMIAKGRRGGTAAINAAKTHCVRGHEFTPDNIYWKAHGKNCRTCAINRSKADYKNKKVAA